MSTTSESPPFRFPDPRFGAAGLAVTAALLALAAAWGAPPAPTAGLSALAAAAAAAVFAGRRRSAPAPVVAAVPPPPPPPPAQDPLGALAIEALERLPDPVMIVSGGDPDDLAGRRIRFANGAARTLLRLPREGGLLVAAVRRPEVLEAVDESLYGRMPRSAAFDIAAAQDRAWRLWTWPLGDDRDGEGEGDSRERRALVVLRDETDARRAERTRVDFLANASHELRTPLASLAGFIETLRGHAKDDPVARDRFLAIMADQAGRMRRLTEDLLSLSRAELNEHLPPTGTCDISGVAADIVAALAPLAQERGIAVALTSLAPAGASLARGERDQMLQVAQNLLDNALKYAPSGSRVTMEVTGPRPSAEIVASSGPRTLADAPDGARVSLLSPDRDGGGRYVSLTVTDEGPGMERSQLPRLADRFFRVEGQKSGARAGTGLGLAIVKHILNRHGGGLVVESAPGRGALFTAYLPAAHAGREPAREPSREPARDGVTETS